MAKLLEFLDRHTARNLFRSSHLNLTEVTMFTRVSHALTREIPPDAEWLLRL